ncbi:MAG: glycosyltransferase family 87 protein [Bacteroidota bacterium]
MRSYLDHFLNSKRSIVIVFVLLGFLTSIQSILSGDKTYGTDDHIYTKYNNYIIFKQSFHHLNQGQELYTAYPEEHWDLYKYTPTFAAFFGIFACFPDSIGLSLWNVLNAVLLVLGIFALPNLNFRTKNLILIISLIELITSLQNEQSNGLIAGLLILAFALCERKQIFWACLCIVFSGFIKIYGLAGLIIFLFYPQKFKSALYTLFWVIFLGLIPLIFVKSELYLSHLTDFMHLLTDDHSSSYGISVMGILNSWFAWEGNKLFIALLGLLLFAIPFLRIKQYESVLFKQSILASLLIWLVIFNHKAESPTYIIALAGIAIWYFQEKQNRLNTILLLLAILLTSLSPTDLFPKIVRNTIIKPYHLKALPCILIWIKLSRDLWLRDYSKREKEISSFQ